ncbi:hypothetical protein F4678DRAFT_457707 [Xylaria arbuscula]|nr:hypothetical protein F4678DRAFT_457707 [Xylaria arbuscula]
MPSNSHSPPIARCLLVATLFTIGFLATVTLSGGLSLGSLEKNAPPPKDESLAPALEKRLLGLGGIVGLVPSLLGNIVPGGIVSSLVAQVTDDVNKLLPGLLDDPSAQAPNGVPLLSGGQPTIPLTAQPLPTTAQLGGLADKLGGLLNGIVPVAAPSIIAEITKQALGVVASVEAIATDVANLGDQISTGHLQGSDALGQIGGLLGSLDSKVNDIVNDVTSNLPADLPLPVLQDLSQAISSGLGDIIGAANGPLSLVGDLIENNVCGIVTPVDGILATVAGICGNIPSAVAQVSSEIATASLTNTDATLGATLTSAASASTIFPSSPSISGVPTATATSAASPSNSQDQGTLTNPATSIPGASSGSPVASGSNTAGNSGNPPASSQQSPSNAGSGSSLSGTQASPGQPSAGSSPSGSSGGVTSTAMASSPSASGSAPGTVSAQPTTAVTPSPSIASSAQPGAAGTSQTTATGESLRQVLSQSTHLVRQHPAPLAPRRPAIVQMPALLLLEATVVKALAQGQVTHAMTVLTVGSALLLKHQRNLLLVDSVGRVPTVKVVGSVLLSRLLVPAEALVRLPLALPAPVLLHPLQEVLRQAYQALHPPRKSQVGRIVVAGQTI